MGLAHNKLYRNFIILQEDERGYPGSRDKSLSGYAKVEAKGDKCKISFYAQNLNPEENYSMVLICCKKDSKQLIDLGPLEISEVGKGDTSKEYYINNIAGLGISYEKISGAAICRKSNGENAFIMYGFMNGEELTENWRKFRILKVDSSKEEGRNSNKEKKKSLDNIEKVDSNSNNDNEVKEQTKEEIKIINDIKSQESGQEIKDKVNIEVEKLDREVETTDDIIDVDIRDDSFYEEDKSKEEDRLDKEDRLDEDTDRHKKCDKDSKQESCKKEKDEKGKTESCKKEKESNKDCKKEDKDKKDKKDKDCKCEKEHKGYKDDNQDQYSLEKYVESLTGKLDDYKGSIDWNITEEGEFIGWILIKSTTIDGTWKKVKIDKKQCIKCKQINEKQYSNKRIEENVNRDALDFEKYEKDIQGLDNSDEFIITDKAGKYFENLAKDFETYDEKLQDINYCKWYKVDVNSIEDLCNKSNYNKYTLAYYPMINYYPYINKNNYFLLGYKCNKDGELQYIVYGIPGSKDKDDQPFGGKTGFVTWTNDNNRSQGYWLMFYDYKNSSIVVPVK